MDVFFLLISIPDNVDLANSAINNYHFDSYTIQRIQGCLGEEMKVDGWVSLILSNREFVVLQFNNGVFMNEGFVVNDMRRNSCQGL